MLVLTRKANQQIQIAENVFVTILQVKGNSVRIGIEAPRDVRVIRGELEPKVDGRPAPESEVTEAELVIPRRSETRSRSTSARQSPLDLGRIRDLRQSAIVRFPVAEASTDAPSEAPTERTTRRMPTQPVREMALPRG